MTSTTFEKVSSPRANYTFSFFSLFIFVLRLFNNPIAISMCLNWLITIILLALWKNQQIFRIESLCKQWKNISKQNIIVSVWIESTPVYEVDKANVKSIFFSIMMRWQFVGIHGVCVLKGVKQLICTVSRE